MSRHALRRGVAVALLSLPLAYAMTRSQHGDLSQINNNPAAYLASQREAASWGFVETFFLIAIILGLVVALVDGATALLARVLPDSRLATRPPGGAAATAPLPSAGASPLLAVTPARPVTPRPVVAGLLSLVVPGLGQLYAGAKLRAVAVWVATYVAFTLLVILFMREPGRVAYACASAGVVLVVLANVLDGARTARRTAAAGTSSSWDPRWPAVTVIGLLFAFGVQPAYIARLRRPVGDAYRLPSSSMAPGLLAGDWITSVPIGSDAVKRGARLVFHAWEGEVLIKRVVALPGDTIAMRNDTLMIGGRPLQEPYVYTDPHPVLETNTDAQFAWQRAHLTAGASAQDYRPSGRTWGPLVVPPDSVFVLGDNRGNSLDSRYRGFVARSAFFSRPTGIYFSRDPDANKIRWRRIGMRIE